MSRHFAFQLQVANSVAQAELDIFDFTVLQAEVIIGSNVLNITVLFTFINTCTATCQETQVFKLKNANSIASESITIIYAGKTHVHNVTLTGQSLSFYLTHSSRCLEVIVVTTSMMTTTPLLTTERTISESRVQTDVISIPVH
jgi:hypothetical protein